MVGAALEAEHVEIPSDALRGKRQRMVGIPIGSSGFIATRGYSIDRRHGNRGFDEIEVKETVAGCDICAGKRCFYGVRPGWEDAEADAGQVIFIGHEKIERLGSAGVDRDVDRPGIECEARTQEQLVDITR